MSSIDTNLEERDDHVRSDAFFNAEAYPFRSTRLRRLDDERFTLTGDLTMRDVTREIKLAAEYEGQIDDPWGNRRSAFNATTQISRNDFNIRWNLLLETSGLAVSDNVQITLHIEAILQAPSPSEPTIATGLMLMNELEFFRLAKDSFLAHAADSPLTPKEREKFAALEYYAEAPELIFDAELRTGVEQTEVTMQTSRGSEQVYRVAGTVLIEMRAAWFS